MMRNTISRITVLLLAMVLAAASVMSSFAAKGPGTFDSDSTDYVTDKSENSTMLRQSYSNNTGTIKLGKILTVNQQNKFPNIEDFVYKITPVSAWDNANQSTEVSGKSIAARVMPKPYTSDKDHHKITNLEGTAAGGAPWCTLVSLGNFKDKSAQNTSSIKNSTDESNTDQIAENRRRTRTTNVSFRFEKAGYYMYKIEEVGSSQNGKVDDISGLSKNVPGVDYDDNFYYVMFYVCNEQATADVNINEYGQGTQKGDTIGQEKALNTVNDDGSQTYGDTAATAANAGGRSGVYVHTITSWTNQNSNAKTGKPETDYRPDNSMRDDDGLADADLIIHDLMNTNDVNPEYDEGYGNSSQDAKGKVDGNTGLNNGRVDNNNSGVVDGDVARSNGSNGRAGGSAANQGPSTVTHDSLGKVAVSQPVPDEPGTPGTPEKPYESDDPYPPADDSDEITGPNKLEAFRMWNDQITHDVVLKKNVTGNLGDRTKQFEFTVEISGLECNQEYTTNVKAGTTEVKNADISDPKNAGLGFKPGKATADETGDQTHHQGGSNVTTGGLRFYDRTGMAEYSDNNGYPEFTTDAGDGHYSNVKFKILLRDDETLVLNSLPRSASYKIAESPSDHVAQFNIVSTNKDTTQPAVFTETSHTPGGTDLDHLGKANSASNKALATETEFVDRYDGTVTIVFQNNRDLATVTGIPGLDYMVYATVISVLGVLALAIVRRRRMYALEEV